MSDEIKKFDTLYRDYLKKHKPKIKPMLLQVVDGGKVDLELQTWWADWSDMIFDNWKSKKELKL